MDVAATLQAAFISMLLGQWLPPEEAGVPAIYAFGDSLIDVGNNKYLPGGDELSKADYFPYGIDYPGGKATGRFSNGYLAVDYLAMMLGFKESPPPSLSITKVEQESRGVNYASGGAGVLGDTGEVCLPMADQMQYFRKSVSRLIHAKGKPAGKRLLAKSIFIFNIASRDILAYESAFGPENATQDEQFINLLADVFWIQLKEIYGLGARKFAIFGTGLLGCFPDERVLIPTNNCNEDLNRLSKMFNNVMEAKLRDLSSKCKGMKYSYINTYEINNSILRKPLKHGLKYTTHPCCGGPEGCFSNSSFCANRNEYMWWDPVHQTQATHNAIARLAYNGSQRLVAPINFGSLVYS